MSDQIDEGFDPLPAGTEAPDPDQELTLQDAVAVGPTLQTTSEPPYQLGRGPAYDFVTLRFKPGVSGGPLMTHGIETLATWVEKCLLTKRGEYLACDPDFGLDLTWTDVLAAGGPFDAALMSEYTAAIKRALPFHPRISGVTNLKVDGSPDSDTAYISFDVELDGDDLRDLTFERLPIGAG